MRLLSQSSGTRKETCQFEKGLMCISKAPLVISSNAPNLWRKVIKKTQQISNG